MSEDPSTQPIITTEEPYIVKIKLLSNEVYEIPCSPTVTLVTCRPQLLSSRN